MSSRTHLLEHPPWYLLLPFAALAYYAAARLGELASLPPANVSPIWPAAGIALALMLRYGAAALPGLLLGAFLFQASYWPPSSQPLVAPGITLAVVLQAGAGAWLIRRLLGRHNPLVDPRSIYLFLLLGGPLSCLVSATLSISLLFWTGVIGHPELWKGWFTWWTGDTLGVLIFTPLTLVMLPGGSAERPRRRLSVGVPLLLLFSLVLILTLALQEKERERLQLDFAQFAGLATESLVRELDDLPVVLEALGQLPLHRIPLDARRFRHFAAPLLARHPSVRALEWIPRIRKDELVEFERRHTLRLRQRTSSGELVSRLTGEVFFPVLHVEPLAENRAAIGFDTASNPLARKAQRLACMRGEAITSAPLSLVQDPPGQPALVLYYPVYRDGIPPSAPELRCGVHLLGYTAALISLPGLLQRNLDLANRPWLGLELRDVTSGEANALVWQHTPAGEPARLDWDRPLQWQREMELGGRHLLLHLYPDNDYVLASLGLESWWFMVGGMLLVGVIGASLLSFTGRALHTQQQVNRRTRELHEEIARREQSERQLRESEERFHAAFDHAPIPMGIVGMDGLMTEVNEAALKATGHTREELIGHSILEITHPEDRERSLAQARRLLGGEIDHYCIEKRYIHKSGEVLYGILECSVIRGAEGRPIGMVAQILDVTPLHRTTAELRKLSQAVEQSPNMVIITNREGAIEYVNPSFERVTGYTRDEVLGKNPSLLRSDLTPGTVYEEMWRTLLAGRPWRGEFQNRTRDGRLFWVEALITPIRDEQGEITHFVSVQEDVTQSRQIREQIAYQATHDRLTGLINRAEFEQRLKRAIHSAAEQHSQHVLCFMDLDQFKVVNDSSGHIAGDELLRQLGALLRSRLRRRDTLARLGGDEFGILMEHCTLEQAREIADKLRQAVEEYRFTWEDKSYQIGASIGLAAITSETGDLTELLKQADTACYAAKDRGRNRIHIYQRDDKALMERQGEMFWVSALNTALAEGGLMLYAQPIRPLTPGHRPHFEVLLRLQGPDGQVVLPGSFMSAAERYNLAERLDRWVIDNTFRWLCRHRERLAQIGRCSINISGQSLGNEALLGHVISLLEGSNLPPGSVLFEITETAAINNLGEALTFMRALKAYGCSFALDDFGSGVSSFAHLKALPVDYLKIDGMFVRDIAVDPIDEAMVRSINEIGHVMGLHTIAEFVENDAILERLRVIGVDLVQGYGIGRPEPLEQEESLRV